MNKLWKHEWKYHIFFIVAVSVILVLVSDVREWLQNVEELVQWSETGEIIFVENVQWHNIICFMEVMCSCITMAFLDKIIWIVLGALLIKKSMIYWIEKNASGREFIQSLPVRKQERVQFHLLMDMLLVLVSVVVYACYEYSAVNYGLGLVQIEISWLGSAYIGMILVSVSFIWMMLGWLHLMESIWVNGTMKLLSFLGSLLMIFIVLRNMFHQFDESKIMQTIYGFFTRKTVAGSYYSLKSWNTHSAGFQYQWVHDLLNIPLLHKGEQIVLETIGVTEEGLQYEFESLSRLYDFTHPRTYIYHVIGYLLIGILVFVIAYALLSKQELSKEAFYFDFGRYLFGGIIAVTFYAMISIAQSFAWQVIVNIVATILVFIILIYLMNPDRKTIWKSKVNES